MSQFTISISEHVRQNLTVAPPPMFSRMTGELVPYAADGQRYADMAIVKAENVVYVDDVLDVYDHPTGHCHHRMMIRSMPWKADLELILAAAHHMMLIGDYTLKYDVREGLDPMMEHGFWDVAYELPKEQYHDDADTLGWHTVHISIAQRKRIWIELFSALGHKVKWGGGVLNVRKRKY